MSYRVLIVEDHDAFRAGVSLFLESEPEIEVVGAVSNGEAALESVVNLHPDVVVMDWVMPGLSGAPLIKGLLKSAPDCNVLVLSMHADPAYLDAALGAGAGGYVLKDETAVCLADAVRGLACGENYFSSGIRDGLGRHQMGPE